jgi:hypothetical protein
MRQSGGNREQPKAQSRIVTKVFLSLFRQVEGVGWLPIVIIFATSSDAAPKEETLVVVNRPSGPNNAMGSTVRSRGYEKGMALLVILVFAAVLFAILYLTPD